MAGGRVRDAAPSPGEATPTLVMQLSQPLPTVDLSRSVASRWLSKARYAQATRLMRAWQSLFVACATLSGVAFVAVLFAPHREIHVACALLSATATPSLLAVASFYSLDVCALLLRSYEYWFMSVLNTTNWVVMAIIFNDIRSVSCLSMWVGAQLVITMDASAASSKFATRFAIMSIPGVVAVAVTCSNELICGANFFVVSIPGLQVHGSNIAGFASSTLCVFLVKKALVTFHPRQSRSFPGRVVPCAVLTARLRLVQEIDNNHLSTAPGPTHQAIQQAETAARPSMTTQLRRAASPPVVFPASRTILTPPAHPWFVWAFALAGVVGLALTIAAWIIILWSPEREHLACIVGIAALISTQCFANVLGSCYGHIGLMGQVGRSFDVLFSTFQHHALALCLCDLMQWRLHTCLAVCCWWVWIFTVSQLDCLPPGAKAQFGYCKRHALPASIMTLSVAVVVAVILATGARRSVFVDRALFQIPLFGEYAFTLHTIDFALQRAATMVAWNLRVPFELATRHDDELLFLKSQVEYETTKAHAVLSPLPSTVGPLVKSGSSEVHNDGSQQPSDAVIK